MSLVLRLEIMIIGVEGDLNLAALLVWCLLFAFEKGTGGITDSMQKVDDVIKNHK